MTNRPFVLFIFWILLFSSCQNQTKEEKHTDSTETTPTPTYPAPNFNYKIDVPKDWTIRDTIMMDGLSIRFLLPPQSLGTDYPAGNVIIAGMEGQSIEDYTTSNMEYLKANMPGITILERGDMDSSANRAKWFTYTKVQQGVYREMINYIIPLNGFAYMITCGSNKGSFKKYRATFDAIARSFKG